jgi:hypothetical protein
VKGTGLLAQPQGFKPRAPNSTAEVDRKNSMLRLSKINVSPK